MDSIKFGLQNQTYYSRLFKKYKEHNINNIHVNISYKIEWLGDVLYGYYIDNKI